MKFFRKLNDIYVSLLKKIYCSLWKYFCRVILYLFINIVPDKWLPYLLFGAIGGLPNEIEVKEENID